MITSAFLALFFRVVSSLIGLLPAVSATSSFGAAISTGSSYISAIHSFLPLITATLLAIVVVDVLFESSYLLFKVIYWIIRRFPTQS
jgi:hypothetical protein